MADSHSVTIWIEELRLGNHEAAQRLWERYWQQLIALARSRLHRRLGIGDEEDVAQVAFYALCNGIEAGKFPELHDRRDLWKLLVVITARKAIHLVDKEKQAPALTQADTLWLQGDSSIPLGSELEQAIGSEPTPELAAQIEEEYQRLLSLLENEELRQIAIWKMEGWKNQEIAEHTGYVTRTIERKLDYIRKIWSEKHG